MRDTSHLKKIPDSNEEPELPVQDSSDEDDYDDYEILPPQTTPPSSPQEKSTIASTPASDQPPVSTPVKKRKIPET